MESQFLLVEGKKALFIISMNLRKNIVKERLYSGKTVSCFAAWGYGDPDHIERLAPLKPHGIFLEGEHGDVDFNNIPNLTRACDIIGATPIVRINQNDQGVIYRTLDLGALGIVVPHVNNKEEAENVVEGGKFYPLGKRGSFTSRQGIGVPNYHDYANDQTLLIVLLEDIIAVENLDEILEVDHIDVFMVPSGDLAQSMGLPGQGNHPEVQAVVDETMRRISKKGKITGAIANKNNVQNIYDNGGRFFLCDPRPYMTEGFSKYQDFAKRNVK